MRSITGILLGLALSVSSVSLAGASEHDNGNIVWGSAGSATAAVDGNPENTSGTRTLLEILRETARSSSSAEGVWSASVEYSETIDRPDLIASHALNEDTARPGFVTLQRSFGQGGFRPYFGVGVGQAHTQFRNEISKQDEVLAIKGVFGGSLKFTDKVDGFIQYAYAVAPGAETELETRRKAHGLQLGLSIELH